MAAATSPAASLSVPGPIYVDTQHEDLVHDSQLDYYGAKLATCSSGKCSSRPSMRRSDANDSISLVFVSYPDRTVKIYNVFDTSYELAATLQGHDGPVWQVSWAHPKFGVILASCSFDGSVLIHRESRPREWTQLYAARQLHESSVNSIAFCPHEFGLMAAAASSDGRVSVLRHDPNNSWSVDYIDDCPMGVNAVSWAPYFAYYNPEQPDALQSPRLVTAGCDNQIRFWVCGENGQWQPDSSKMDTSLTHSDWVRDVAWAPCLLPNHNMVASCSEDRKVLIWTQEEAGGEWKATLLNEFAAPVWRVSWSVTGHLLAVSSGDADVTLWKAGLDGAWTQVGMVEDTTAGTEQAQG